MLIYLSLSALMLVLAYRSQQRAVRQLYLLSSVLNALTGLVYLLFSQ